MMKKAIVFDLDDTLIETKTRQYQLIVDFFSKEYSQIPNFEDYIKFRRYNRASNTEFIRQFNSNEELLQHFRIYYSEKIEDESTLKLDTLIVEKRNLKILLDSNIELIILSLRKNVLNAKNQLVNLHIGSFFSHVHFIGHDDLKNPKIDVLKSLKNKFNIVCFVGDSDSDLEAAFENNIQPIAVETGMYKIEIECEKFININEFIENYSKR